MKKFLVMLLAAMMLVSLAACQPVNPTEPNADPTNGATNPPTDPPNDPTDPTEPEIYNGFTASELDAIPGIEADGFQNAMDVTWNFGWEGNATIEHNATKVDFSGTATSDSPVWRVGTTAAEGAAICDNAGWGVTLWSNGEGNIAYMYAKVDVPATITQFRIWAVGNKDNYWSGSGAFRAVALYKNETGAYVKTILLPTAESFVGNLTTTLHDDGSVRFSNAMWSLPDTIDGCMVIYDPTELLGKEDVIIFVEGIGVGNVLGDEYTEAAEGVPAGQVMPDVVIVKRVMFL